jgi:hypothetical protein
MPAGPRPVLIGGRVTTRAAAKKRVKEGKVKEGKVKEGKVGEKKKPQKKKPEKKKPEKKVPSVTLAPIKWSELEKTVENEITYYYYEEQWRTRQGVYNRRNRDKERKVVGEEEFLARQRAQKRQRVVLPKKKETPSELLRKLQQLNDSVIGAYDDRKKVNLPNIIASAEEKVSALIEDVERVSSCKNLVEEILKLNPNVKRKSLDQYVATIKNIFMERFPGKDFTCSIEDFQFLKNAQSEITSIQRDYDSINTQATKFTHIASILKYLEGFQDAYARYIQVASVLNQQYKKSRQDEKAPEDFVRYEEMLEGFNKRVNKKKIELKDKVIAAFFLLRPPRRVKPLQYMRVKTITKKKRKGLKKISGTDQLPNFLLVSKDGTPQKFQYNNYKTVKDYGVQTFKIENRQLRDLFKQYMKEQNIKAGDFLFPSADGTPYENFSQIIASAMNRATGYELGVNKIRRAAVTYYWAKIEREGKQKSKRKEELAYRMAHKKSTAEDLYQREL